MATPSTNVSTDSVATTCPASNDSSVAGAPVGDDADDLGRQAEQVAHRHHAADARAHADRHVDDVEVGHGARTARGRTSPRRARGRARTARPSAARRSVGQAPGRARAPPGSRRRARSARRRGRPSPRSSRRCCRAARRSSPAGRAAARRRPGSGRGCPASALTTPARSGRSRARRSTSTSPPRILNAPVGVCVLVLHPHLGAELGGEQRPGVRRRHRDVAADELGRPLEVGQREQRSGGSGIGHHQVEADVVGLGREVVDELLGERRADVTQSARSRGRKRS